MAEIVDLTADSPPDAPADDSAVVARLELFTGASADAARAALRAHGNDADAAASALLAARRRCSIPTVRAFGFEDGGDCESVKSYGVELSNDGTEVLWERIGRVLAWTATG